jgi:hypothetical protein
MGGTLFALVAYFNSTECLSHQLHKRSSIHGLHGSISSQTAIEVDFSEVRLTFILRTSPYQSSQKFSIAASRYLEH